jgi:hypothetical protein
MKRRTLVPRVTNNYSECDFEFYLHFQIIRIYYTVKLITVEASGISSGPSEKCVIAQNNSHPVYYY